MDSLLVQKYGGTSVGSPERIRAVADRIAFAHSQGHSLVVVVSAMGHTTDELLELASQVSKKPSERELDMLLTAGERISMALLSMALLDRGVSAVSFTGSQSGIITDGEHLRARIHQISGGRVKEALALGKVAIIAGFQGVSLEREITTLGRGGSDTTAVAVAASLGAKVCEIYTDVDAVYSADPRIVTGAKAYQAVDYDSMIVAAHLGSQVLHPRSVELAKRYGVEIRVLNSFSSSLDSTGLGTSIKKENMEKHRFTAVTHDPKKGILEVELARPTLVSAVLDYSKEHKLSMTMPQMADGKITFYYEKSDLDIWTTGLTQHLSNGFINQFKLRDDFEPVSLVGERLTQDGAAMGEVIDSLNREHIPFRHIWVTPITISLGIPSTHAQDAVKILHKDLIVQ